jgi:HEAT repeat protein
MSDPLDSAARRALARHPDEETRYQAMSRLDPSDAGDLAAILESLADPSWRVRSAAVEQIGTSPGGAAAIPQLVDALSGGPNVGARDAAAAALARIGAAAAPALIERLASPDADQRQAAAGVLGVIADRRAVAPLTARLADADPNVRAAAAEALGRIGGREAVDALGAAVDSDDATLRSTALDALRRQGTCLPVEVMERLLQDRTLRRPAYRLLGASDDPASLPLVARGVAEISRAARDAALGALGQLRSRRPPEALQPLLDAVRAAAAADPGLTDAWSVALASEEPFVAVGALAALGAAGSPRHVVAMLRLAEDDRFRALVDEALEAMPAGPELRVALAEALPVLGQLARLAALAALARLGSPAAFENLVREASDPGSYVQSEAVAALGRLSDARGVAPLAGLLGDDAPAVAGLAATALVRIAQSEAPGRAAVLAALRARADAGPSAALYRTLGAVGEADDADLLLSGLRSETVAHRGAAAAALAVLARRGLLRRRDMPGLVAAVSDGAWSVRAAAARAYAELARAAAAEGAAGAVLPAVGPEAAAALRAALRDREAAVRAAAIDALGACGVAENAGVIAAVVEDPETPAPVVVAALHALAVLGATRPDVITRAAAHADPEVVKEAVLAAARLPGPDGERILRAAATSGRWDVRQAAARAMAERADPNLAELAGRLASTEPDPLVARAFAEASRVLERR